MTAVLWHIELSHYNEKARWALDYKGIPYKRRAPMPGTTGPVSLALTRGASRRMPVLQLDGETIADSTAIIAALEEHTPEPALYPADAGERAQALALEEFFDEELGPEVRRFGWQHMMQDGDVAADALFGDRHRGQARMLKTGMPLTRVMLRSDYGISEETALRARAKIIAAMDRVEAELGGGDHLVGDAFSVADLSAAALFTPLLRPPGRPFAPQGVPPAALRELEDELVARPGGEWVFEMYRRHRGAYAGIPA